MSTASTRALVFDLDGTLVDSAPDIHASLVRVLVADGRRALTLPEVKAMVGDGVRSLIELALAATGGPPAASQVDDVLDRFRTDYLAHLLDLTRPYPGVVDGLARLADAGWRLAVCTNKLEGPARRILDGLGLTATFGAIVGGDTLPTRKPDAAPLLAAATGAGATATNAILVGDGPHDWQAAQAAATGFIGVEWGYQPTAIRALDARAVFVARFDQLADLAAAMAVSRRSAHGG